MILIDGALRNGHGATNLPSAVGGWLGAPRSLQPAWGIGLMLAVGALLGLLHATAQQRTSVRGYLTVGLFYGLLIFVIARVVSQVFLPHPLAAAIGSWHWLVACLVFGLALAIVAVVFSAARPAHPGSVAID